MKILLYIFCTAALFSCTKLENRLEGSWFVTYLINDTKTNDFTLQLEEDGTGLKDGQVELTWNLKKKVLSITTSNYTVDWDNNRNKKNEQYFISTDSLEQFHRMEMERIQE
ncbi:MAG: hypothetical protein ACI9U0_000742 [Flavobacteriales bacterium]|jgi:hypothetical protein|tara:strand:- start:2395 stop:2727 length:333 start_codon:yes stop_codon:yes gene_type:complete